MKRIAVVGYKGKMGQPIFLALQKKFNVVGIGRNDNLDRYENLDLVIDVASHDSSVNSAEYCFKNNIPVIIGATGQTAIENERIEEISRHITVIKKANFAIGIEVVKIFINVLLKLNPLTVKITEKHHEGKKDAPSGTALMIREYIINKFDGDVEIQSVREGDLMGEHLIRFYFQDEIIELKHEVLSRMVFVNGVLKEVEKLLKKIDKKSENL